LKKYWIIPFVILIALVGAWFFRWEKGPTQTKDGLTVIYLRDRWTCQSWVKFYGVSGGRLYSGEMRPVVSPNDIANRKLKILNSSETTQRKLDLNKQIDDYNKEKSQHHFAHLTYFELVKKNKELADMKNGNRFSFLLPIDEISRHQEYEQGISENIIYEQDLWIDANEKYNKAKSELANQPKNAEERAESELRTWAWQVRKIATGIWAGLLLLTILITVILLKQDKKTT